MVAPWNFPVLATYTPNSAFPVNRSLTDFHRGSTKNLHPITTVNTHQKPIHLLLPWIDSPTLSPCLDPPQILPKGTYSFNRPRCSSLNRIKASIELLVTNFFFWLSPLFLHVNITTTISPKGYIGIPIAQYSPPPHPSHPLPLKQGLNTHEPICQ